MKDAGSPTSFLFSKRSMMGRGSRRAGWFSIAMVTRISVAIVLARLKSNACSRRGSGKYGCGAPDEDEHNTGKRSYQQFSELRSPRAKAGSTYERLHEFYTIPLLSVINFMKMCA